MYLVMNERKEVIVPTTAWLGPLPKAELIHKSWNNVLNEVRDINLEDPSLQMRILIFVTFKYVNSFILNTNHLLVEIDLSLKNVWEGR